ncbi:MAG: outer membrane protein assembly factor BamA [Alphaproteobacteria bacterium]|nr:outer membrane protein assembly factor BamA [Alphaproteobacteria bacterium]
MKHLRTTEYGPDKPSSVCRCWRAAFLLAVAGVLFSPAYAQAPSATGPVIGSIEVTGNQRIESETVRSYMTVRPGSEFDDAKIDQSLKTLFSTGLFADVKIRRASNNLVVNVVENPIINQVAFEGNSAIKDENLDTEVHLKPRVVYTRARVQEDLKRIIEVYRRSGRFAATVEPKVIQLPQNRVDLVFEIKEGSVTGIRQVYFIGNRRFSDDRLRSEISTQVSKWWNFLASRDNYDPDRLVFDREQLRKFYLSRGYADFRVVSAVAEMTRDREQFFITFVVDEGLPYDFGTIDIKTELEKIDPEQLREKIKTVSGELYNAKLIDDTVEDLTFAAGEFGYAFVDIRPQIKRQKGARKIDIVYQIKEGPRVYVEKINIEGNVRTLDRVIRREFRIVEGDAFNSAKLNRSRSRIRGLNFFANVEVTQTPGESPDRTIVNVDVKEKSTGQLSFGVGFSSTESLIADISIAERNLLGKGQFLRASAQASSLTQQYQLSFTEPYFMDREMAAGFDLFRIRNDYTDYASFLTQQTGFTLSLGAPLSEYARGRLQYSLAQDKISGAPVNASQFILAALGTDVTSLVGYAYTYLDVDDDLDPHRGYSFTFQQNFAGLGGDVRYVLTEGEAKYFYPLAEEVVGNLSVRSGYIKGINQDVRLNDRFFKGGRTFRGFKIAGLGPRDLFTDDALGGQFYYIGTAQMTFPLGLPEEFGILGNLFTDAGAVTTPVEKDFAVLNSNSPRVAVGFGVAWDSPFGPIRLDLAKAVVKEDFDQTETFRFDVGTKF